MTDKKVGRPRTTVDPPPGQRKKTGLQTGDTRATFVITEQLWHELREYQNTSTYRTMRELMATMIETWLRDHRE